MRKIIQKISFVFRIRYYAKFIGALRKYWFFIFGMRVGSNTILPKLFITWPNQLRIGSNCILEKHTIFKYDGIWQNGPSILIGNDVFIGSGCEFNITCGIQIGDFANIASGCKFIDHDHGKSLASRIGSQLADERPICIGNDVWLGCNVVILKGVKIGEGAIVGAGAVVTRSIFANEIWAGVPAKKIGERSL